MDGKTAKLWTPGDWNALFGLGTNVLVNLLVLTGLLKFVVGMPDEIVMRHRTPHFAHVFAGGGYAAGYYSYMWSEMMDADAFAAFEEAGDPFDAEVARRLERHVLSAGGSDEAEALYTAFRGRMPGVEALLRGRGLDDAA